MGSIFDILGPVMVGPSSSHTAGAARIGLIARQLFGRQPKKATVYLHGSFAATGKGHGTDRALIAGLLGMKPDDMRIPNSFEIAREEGMEFTIENKDIKEAHPNTAQIIMEAEGVNTMKIQAYSIGGGRIRVCKLDGIDVNFSGESNTLIIRNVDEPGRIKEVASALSNAEINIATMQVFRDKRGGFAVMVVETDQVVPKEAIDDLESKQGIIRVKFLNANGETE
ncbi:MULTISPECIES: L-serine ammonia-lyase, iron-sulfur-dependent subunit beta [Lachnospiraceae]|uniref:L-serine ammonia-lyase, iron-sulfur-dependent subunit beta n=1 Tax=Lachnospiraceae TaxID=186803 RepID=UPI001F1DC476|nr:L-serine ammonia-lyase, iron-sulfur-dependent subunit beta [Faecalicatena contorta]MCI6120558.1 L-serine ammonia-lyase, iron-sulfur-dependent subunit beta [Lachnospiraceae bacterium]MCF2667799.1 L-serine ammonia-lyase, iron-sulfur-dependent subunit beta [Faecalicatena contorta]MCI6535589.1 L-serine ammonia-lyase, iron-sulfur-dependent subunit beta [Lachnospiraceae bacterium]MDY2613495.1 L-serine ammonia-lyase, iron-sulfur-dependent subunit beta [Lachnospiraceae bacterium]MDY4207114.1 L-seri